MANFLTGLASSVIGQISQPGTLNARDLFAAKAYIEAHPELPAPLSFSSKAERQAAIGSYMQLASRESPVVAAITAAGAATNQEVKPVAGIADLFVSTGQAFLQNNLNSLVQGPAIPAETAALEGVVGKILQGLGIHSVTQGVESILGIGGQSSVQEAPKASLIMGTCPPGRVRRKVAWGRDICAKKPTMNPLNPKALRRATTRMARFHAFAEKTEKEIQKSFRKAGVHSARRTSSRCGTCRKTRCSCS